MAVPSNDRLSASQVLSSGSGWGVVKGTTVEATTTPDEPGYSTFYDPTHPNFNGTAVRTVWFTLPDVPAGGVFLKIEPDPAAYIELWAIPGDQSTITAATVEIAIATAYSDGSSYPEAADHPGGPLSFMVLSYDTAGSTSEVPVPFTFGWGSAVLDSDPSHWGETVQAPWTLWDAAFQASTNYYGLNVSTSGWRGARLHLELGVVANNNGGRRGQVGADHPGITRDVGTEAAVWNSARRGNVGDLVTVGSELNSGTTATGELGQDSGLGFWHNLKPYDPAFGQNSYQSVIRTTIADGGIDVLGPRSIRTPPHRLPGQPTEPVWGWANVVDGTDPFDKQLNNDLRNLHVEVVTEVRLWDRNGATGESLPWSVEVVGLLRGDRRPENALSTEPVPAEANLWDSYWGVTWQDPGRTDQPVIATIPATHDNIAAWDFPDPEPWLQPGYETGGDYTNREDTVYLDRDHLVPWYFRTPRMRDSTPPDADVRQIVTFWRGTTRDDGTVAQGYCTVEFREPPFRPYLGFPLELKVRQAPPMRQRARQDGLAAGTGARRGGSEPEMRQRSVRRGSGVVW